MPKRKKHTVKLLIQDPKVEKVWAAVKLLSTYSAIKAKLGDVDCWVGIEDIGDFLRRRQIDAAHTGFDDKNPNTRYALRSNRVEKHKWDDSTVVGALNTCVNKGLLQHIRCEKGNFFAPKKPGERDLWKLQNTETPELKKWRTEKGI